MTLIDDTRSAWGARASTNPQHVAAGARLGISWHYPGGSSTITPASDHKRCLSQVLAWQRYHQTDRRWADLGYNALICQHGRVIEGRGLDLIGAHSPGVNATHYGVQFMVSGDTLPNPAMLARAVQLRADLEERSGRTLRQWGHRDDPRAATACPGDAIERWVTTGGPYAALVPGGGQSAPIPKPQPKPVTKPTAKPKPAPTAGARPWLIAGQGGVYSNLLRPGTNQSTSVYLYQLALRRYLNKYAAKYNPSGATGNYGHETETMTGRVYLDLAKNAGPRRNYDGWLTKKQVEGKAPLPTWPGGSLLKALGLRDLGHS